MMEDSMELYIAYQPTSSGRRERRPKRRREENFAAMSCINKAKSCHTDAMQVLMGRGTTAPTHSLPRHYMGVRALSIVSDHGRDDRAIGVRSPAVAKECFL
jgi:hypothetical protein